MRSPLRIPPAELNQIITEGVDEYMLEVRRVRRLTLRQVFIDTCQALGRPVFEGEEMEAHIDVLEALIAAGDKDPDKILQLTHELPFPPDGKLSSHQILLHLEPHLV